MARASSGKKKFCFGMAAMASTPCPRGIVFGNNKEPLGTDRSQRVQRVNQNTIKLQYPAFAHNQTWATEARTVVAGVQILGEQAGKHPGMALD